MKACMGDGSSWSDEEDDVTQANSDGVKVDEGFADVDRAVAEQEAKKARANGNGNGHVKDPTGGRGTNGHITKQLKEVQENGRIKPWNTSADAEGKVQ
ncbi:MAG: hypothetical protein M1823_008520, partial [Watsoniomyces obsoletus]